MSAKMETQLKALRDSMGDLDTDVQPEETKMAEKAVKKATKKVVAKKVPAKAEKAAPEKKAKKAAPAADGAVTLKDLAKEAKLEAHIARRQLRKAGIPNEGRWSWEDGTPALRKAREALGLG